MKRSSGDEARHAASTQREAKTFTPVAPLSKAVFLPIWAAEWAAKQRLCLNREYAPKPESLALQRVSRALTPCWWSRCSAMLRPSQKPIAGGRNELSRSDAGGGRP